MHRAWFLLVTAFIEVGASLPLIVLPAAPIERLLGVSQAAPEAEVIARLAGGALLAIGVTCLLARNDQPSSAQLGVLTGVLIYDVVAAALLAYVGSVLGMAGIALWPAVALHTALAAWCVSCFHIGPQDRSTTPGRE